MRQTTYHCDGLARLSTLRKGWFSLLQPVNPDTDTARLQRALHFCSIDCLAHWTDRAAGILPALIKTASSVHPRGLFSSKEVPGLFV